MLGVITVAVDGSEPAAAALAMAVDLAKHYRAELVILAVAPLAPVVVMPNEPLVAPVLPESLLPQFRSIVDGAVRAAKDAGVSGVTGVCYDGVVVDEILAHLAGHPADLLVVGSRGLSTAKRILLGSTSEALVARAPCPVLVVRSSVRKPPAASA